MWDSSRIVSIGKVEKFNDMDNVYDIKRKKNLNFILPIDSGSKSFRHLFVHCRAVVIIHLHYLDTLNRYIEYAKNIPDHIDLIFSTAIDEIKERLDTDVVKGRKNCKVIRKKNRGRDISAFLVACRKDILEYDFVCFLHDKKEKAQVYEGDTEKWIRCLWENMIGSKEFIDNLLETFHENENLGLLVSPAPISEHFPATYINMWGNNFEKTQLIAQRLRLKCDLDPAKPPITLGTVFWARVEALKKLFETEWRYEDFDEEPLREEGTVSHAVERILAFVAQDAGFETGWVMTDRYASERFEYEQEVLEKAFHRLNLSAGVFLISELNDYEDRVQKLLDFVKDYGRIYIFGAGMYAKSCFAMLRNEGVWPEAFIVTEKNQNPAFIEKIPVSSIDQVKLDGECGVIIGVGKRYQKEVLQILHKKYPEFSNIYLYERIMANLVS